MTAATRAYSPRSLAEALRILADRDLGAIPVAGCTDLLASAHTTGRHPAAVVDLTRVPELCGIRRGDGVLDIGAATTFTQLRESEAARAVAPVLVQAAATVGAWQIQNRATLGGNIANASPAGDSLPVLLALDAELDLASERGGTRRLRYDAMHVGYRKTALVAGELIVRIRIPEAAGLRVGAFRKVGTRAAQAISKVAVALAARSQDRKLTGVRIAAGSVAAVPVRLRGAEAALEGSVPDAECAERAAAVAASEVTPIDDVRSTAEYRRFVLANLVRRMIVESGKIGE